MVPDQRQISLLGHVRIPADMHIKWRWVGGSRNPVVGCGSDTRGESLELLLSLCATAKQEKDGRSEVICGHHKEVKVVQWNEYDGGRWLSVLVVRFTAI